MTKQKRNNINTNKTTATLQVTTFKNIASNNRPIKPIVICSNSTMEIPDLMFLISSKFSLTEFVNFERISQFCQWFPLLTFNNKLTPAEYLFARKKIMIFKDRLCDQEGKCKRVMQEKISFSKI